jgi:hypothetical protein
MNMGLAPAIRAWHDWQRSIVRVPHSPQKSDVVPYVVVAVMT